MAKKKVVKKSPVKTVAAKKTVAKKKASPASKSAPKKKVVTKAAPKKKVAAKVAPKKKAAAKTVTKKAAPKKSVAKAAPKKAVAVKAATAKVAPKKTAPVKASAVKSVAAKVAPAKKTAEKEVKTKASAPVTKDAARLLAESVIEGMLDKKASNIKWLDLRNIENAVCDYFIICEGSSNTQVEAIADSVETMVKKQLGQRPMRSEGWENALWILIDYFDVVVHVFEHDTRQFYNLESLWADAEEIAVKQ